MISVSGHLTQIALEQFRRQNDQQEDLRQTRLPGAPAYRSGSAVARSPHGSAATVIPFVADEQWQPIRVDFSQLRYQIDMQALLGVAFVASPPAGHFVF